MWELIREWIVYPFGIRTREPRRRERRRVMSAIAAAPLAPQPRGNDREKQPPPRSALLPQKFPIVGGNITCLYQRVAEPGSLNPDRARRKIGGVTDTEDMAGTGFYYLHPLLAGSIEEWREHSTGSRRWGSAR